MSRLWGLGCPQRLGGIGLEPGFSGLGCFGRRLPADRNRRGHKDRRNTSPPSPPLSGSTVRLRDRSGTRASGLSWRARLPETEGRHFRRAEGTSGGFAVKPGAAGLTDAANTLFVSTTLPFALSSEVLLPSYEYLLREGDFVPLDDYALSRHFVPPRETVPLTAGTS